MSIFGRPLRPLIPRDPLCPQRSVEQSGRFRPRRSPRKRWSETLNDTNALDEPPPYDKRLGRYDRRRLCHRRRQCRQPRGKAAHARSKGLVKAKLPPTELRVGEDEWTRPILGLPHTDEAGWWAQARVAFGTVSAPFVEAEIARLLSVLRSRNSTLQLETEVNAALAMIEGVPPRNEVEAMMAVQMALAHVAALEMLARAGSPVPEQSTAASATAAKLMRTFAGHADVLARMRRPAVQVVRVERVNIEAGAQAFVGVAQGGGPSKIGDQAHGTEYQRAVEFANDAPMRSEKARWLPLPEAAGERPDAVSSSWRRARQRCP